MAKQKIVIIGGGVAGMSAAHELLKRGFAVDIYELNDLPGGKARSLEVPISEFPPLSGKLPLPAEHGFRFFPGFYQHLNETMSEINSPVTGSTVLNSLVNVDVANFGRMNRSLVQIPTKFPDNPWEFSKLLATWHSKEQIGMGLDELLLYAARVEELVTSCNERIDKEFERQSWWEFVDATHRTTEYKRFFAGGTRMLVAADPRKASARTNGTLLERMMRCQNENQTDRILNGPTNQAWLFPWLHQLLSTGDLRYFVNARAIEVLTDVATKTVHGIVVEDRNPSNAPFAEIDECDPKIGPHYIKATLPTTPVVADAYVLAVPVEVIAGFVKSTSAPPDPKVDNPAHWTDLGKADPNLRFTWQLSTHVAWMNGAVFYLSGKPDPVKGHTMYVDTPFSLTSIFQGQHWNKTHYPLSQYGNGLLTEILSIDISNWRDTENCSEPACDIPFGGKGRLSNQSAERAFKDGGSKKVLEDVFQDVKDSLDGRLKNAKIERQFLDPAIGIGKNGEVTNSEPLLVNQPGTMTIRPKAVTQIGNLFLASDYVLTETDLACMEAANEAAKHAVNGILKRFNSPHKPCNTLPRQRLESKILSLLRELDRILFSTNKPNSARARFDSMKISAKLMKMGFE